MFSLLTILSVFFVTFTDKQGCAPIAFSDRALEQRTKWAIPTDSLDYAVSTTYTDSVRALGGDIMHVSRWLNGATVACEDSVADLIAACSFVKTIEKTREKSGTKASTGDAGVSPAVNCPGTQASSPAIKEVRSPGRTNSICPTAQAPSPAIKEVRSPGRTNSICPTAQASTGDAGISPAVNCPGTQASSPADKATQGSAVSTNFPAPLAGRGIGGGATQGSAVSEQPQTTAQPSDSARTLPQLTLFNLLPLHQAGYRGEGIVMAVIDGGFQNYPIGNHSDHALASYLDTTHWLGSYDFTDDADDFYSATGYHGTMCLGLIAGESTGDAGVSPAVNCPGMQASSPADYPTTSRQAAEGNTYLGAATAADYYLMRSEEDGKESPKEMDNLVAALEKADSLGVNIASISLGYSEFDNEEWNFGYADMNGQTTRCSQAALIAARKGMLVCVAAGNEGNKTWHYLTAPADADSILCVGAVDSEGVVSAFSSRGPGSDGRVKPDVCAVGSGSCVLNPGDGSIQYGNGTSFACPLIAGMAACVWSALPDLSAQEIRRRIICSADRYHTPDADYGYGIPDAWLAYIGKEADLNDPQYSSRPIGSTNAPTCQKIYRNGTLYILRGTQYYDPLGRTVAF